MATSASNSSRRVSGSDHSISRFLPWREICLLGLGTLALFTLLALGSHHPTDPGFSYSTEIAQAQNLFGRSGAFFADLTLYLLGQMAYLIPVALVIAGTRLFMSKASVPHWLVASIRTTGWVSVTLCGCVLLALHADPNSSLPAGAGGVLGQWFAQQGNAVFGWVGLSILGIAGVLIGAQAAAGFSWLDVCEFLGRYLHIAWQIARNAYDIGRDRWHAFAQARAANAAARRRERALQVSQNPATQIGPKIEHPDVKRVQSEPTAPDTGIVASAASSLVKIVPKVTEKPNKKAQQKRLFDTKSINEMPDLDLLDSAEVEEDLGYSTESLEAMSRQLELKLADFGVEARVVSVLPGPVITRFEIQPAAGVKVQKISALAKDLARSLAVISVRIVEVIPGKSVVGIEIPNEHRETVQLREVIASDTFQNSASKMTLALGKDIAGASIVADVAKMPHLLVAGTTGSGKSVGVNAMLLSILYKATPEDVRLILVDPKMLELSVYEGIPHLLAPVVTDMKEAAHALNWCVAEMERRYKLMASMGVRNLAGFNRQINEARERGEPHLDPLWTNELEAAPELETLPNIVVVIDEFADMMMIVGKKVEQLIARIAQKARAAGIHLILATQRPSVDVITGLIKANIPTRMGFQVSSKVDSRTILDQGGAEQLLGHGDMLYLPPGTALPQRVHGAFVSDDEVHRVVSDWKARGAPDYLEEILSGETEGEPFVQIESDGDTEQEDELYDEAVQFVLESRRASISAVQRKLRIGYNRAARLIEAMEAAGMVSPMNANGSREIIVPNRE
ncbi:MAG: DNA translocase FtsK 4TM domain-containing protein [Pseudomonadota bacterium]